MRKTPVAAAVSLSLANGSIALTSTVFAQSEVDDESLESIEAVIVTGSRIRKDVFTSSTPLDVIDIGEASIQGIVAGHGAGIPPGASESISYLVGRDISGVVRQSLVRTAQHALEMADRQIGLADQGRYGLQHRPEIPLSFELGIARRQICQSRMDEDIACGGDGEVPRRWLRVG